MAKLNAAEGEIPLLTLLPIIYRSISFDHLKKKYGLTKSQLVVLLSLSTHEMLNMTQAAKDIASSKEQATRSVAPLADAGYVERFESAENRTHVFIRLTEKGKALMEAFHADCRQHFDAKIKAALTPEEQDRLREAIATIEEILDKIP